MRHRNRVRDTAYTQSISPSSLKLTVPVMVSESLIDYAKYSQAAGQMAAESRQPSYTPPTTTTTTSDFGSTAASLKLPLLQELNNCYPLNLGGKTSVFSSLMQKRSKQRYSVVPPRSQLLESIRTDGQRSMAYNQMSTPSAKHHEQNSLRGYTENIRSMAESPEPQNRRMRRLSQSECEALRHSSKSVDLSTGWNGGDINNISTKQSRVSLMDDYGTFPEKGGLMMEIMSPQALNVHLHQELAVQERSKSSKINKLLKKFEQEFEQEEKENRCLIAAVTKSAQDEYKETCLKRIKQQKEAQTSSYKRALKNSMVAADEGKFVFEVTAANECKGY